MANYFRKQGGKDVWEERPGKSPRYISFKEAKEKDLWSKVKNVSSTVYKQLFPNTTEAEEKKKAASKVFSKEYGRQGPAKKPDTLKKKEPVKKKEYYITPKTKAQQKAKEDYDKYLEENYGGGKAEKLEAQYRKDKGKKVSAVRKLAAEKLLNKKEKSKYVRTKTLKDGTVVGYKENGKWDVIKTGKYKKKKVLDDGTVIGYKENGEWELIKKGKGIRTTAKSKYISMKRLADGRLMGLKKDGTWEENTEV